MLDVAIWSEIYTLFEPLPSIEPCVRMFRLLLRCALQGLAVALSFDLASLCTVLVL